MAFQTELERIKGVAQEVRGDFETGRAYTDRLLKLYIEYSPILANAIAFFSGAKDLFPAGNCGLATVALRDRLGVGFPSQDIYYERPNAAWNTIPF